MSTHDIFRATESADTIGIMRPANLVMQQTRAALSGEDLERLYMEHMAGVTE